MRNPDKTRIPPKLTLTIYLSGGYTIVLSLLYIALGVIALIFRFTCIHGSEENITPNNAFWKIIYRQYILHESCGENGITDITNSYTIFILIIVVTATSVLNLIAGVILITSTMNHVSRCIHLVNIVYGYAFVWIIALVADLVLAVYLGRDYTTLTGLLINIDNSPLNLYITEVLRQGSLMLMSVAVKGYLAPAVNTVLIALLIYYAVEYQKMLYVTEHSIHRLGALKAYEAAGQVNPTFAGDGDHRSPVEQPHESDYFKSFDRSESWYHSHPEKVQGGPYPYAESRRAPQSTGPLRRDSPPPLPNPDYSPLSVPRLKSALKPSNVR